MLHRDKTFFLWKRVRWHIFILNFDILTCCVNVIKNKIRKYIDSPEIRLRRKRTREGVFFTFFTMYTFIKCKSILYLFFINISSFSYLHFYRIFLKCSSLRFYTVFSAVSPKAALFIFKASVSADNASHNFNYKNFTIFNWIFISQHIFRDSNWSISK